MTDNLRAYHGNPAIKAMYLERVHAHRVANELVRHYSYWVDGRGCAVGCTIHGNSHKQYEVELGIPVTVAHLEDIIFECLPRPCAMQWPERFLEAIPVGADLSQIADRLMLWLFTTTDSAWSPASYYASDRFYGHAVQTFKRHLRGETTSAGDWFYSGYSLDMGHAVRYHYLQLTNSRAYNEGVSDDEYAYALVGIPRVPGSVGYDAYNNYWIDVAEKLLALLADAPVLSPITAATEAMLPNDRYEEEYRHGRWD